MDVIKLTTLKIKMFLESTGMSHDKFSKLVCGNGNLFKRLEKEELTIKTLRKIDQVITDYSEKVGE